VNGIAKTYAGSQVPSLSGVTIQVESGAVVGLAGPNGAGKSTLMGCLIGFLFPDAGEIRIDGFAPETFAARARIGHVPERLRLDGWLPGREFLEFHAALSGVGPGFRRAAADRWLERVGFPSAAAVEPIRTYSRGMIQRLMLAHAFIGDPTAILLDEPTSGMDPDRVARAIALIGEARARGAAVLLCSHQLDLIERLADRVVYLREGRVVSDDAYRTAATTRRFIVVRILPKKGGRGGAATLWSRAARLAGAILESENGTRATFMVQDDEAAARLMQVLADLGAAVVEAASRADRMTGLPSQ